MRNIDTRRFVEHDTTLSRKRIPKRMHVVQVDPIPQVFILEKPPLKEVKDYVSTGIKDKTFTRNIRIRQYSNDIQPTVGKMTDCALRYGRVIRNLVR